MPISIHCRRRRTVLSQDSWLLIAEETKDGDDDSCTEATYCDSDSEASSSDDDTCRNRSSCSHHDNDIDADLYMWKKWQSTFARSTQDLLSDYVDPDAERHMILPGEPGPAPMPPFSFYCQKTSRTSKSSSSNSKHWELADDLDYFSTFPKRTQPESPRKPKTTRPVYNWYQKKKSSSSHHQQQQQQQGSTQFLLHRFARC